MAADFGAVADGEGRPALRTSLTPADDRVLGLDPRLVARSPTPLCDVLDRVPWHVWRR